MRPLFDIDSYTAFVTALPGGRIVEQWESHVAKVGDKVFAMLSLDRAEGPYISMKCLKDEFDLLDAIPGIGQAPYCPRRQWVQVLAVTELPDDEIAERLQEAYGLIAANLTRKARTELGICDELLVR